MTSAVDERAVDDPVDVVEPVAEDRDARRRPGRRRSRAAAITSQTPVERRPPEEERTADEARPPGRRRWRHPLELLPLEPASGGSGATSEIAASDQQASKHQHERHVRDDSSGVAGHLDCVRVLDDVEASSGAGHEHHPRQQAITIPARRTRGPAASGAREAGRRGKQEDQRSAQDERGARKSHDCSQAIAVLRRAAPGPGDERVGRRTRSRRPSREDHSQAEEDPADRVLGPAGGDERPYGREREQSDDEERRSPTCDPIVHLVGVRSS